MAYCGKESKKVGKDQESIQSSTTPDQGYHMGKWQNYKLQTRAKQVMNTQKHGKHKT